MNAHVRKPHAHSHAHAHVHPGAHPGARKLGRRPRSFNPAVPHYSALRRQGTPAAPPAAATWLDGMPQDLGMMLNDKLGDCTCAGLGHAIQVWSHASQGRMDTPTDADVLELYEQGCGYVKGDPSTDQGGVEQDLLSFCVDTGIPANGGRDKLLAFVELDPRQHDDVKNCIAEGGPCYMGIEIPAAWSQAQAGDTWDVTDSPIEGGHCVIAAGYDAEGLDIISWGMRFRMTWAAWDQYVDEAYWLASRDFIAATGKTPGGLTVAQLEAAMQAVRAG